MNDSRMIVKLQRPVGHRTELEFLEHCLYVFHYGYPTKPVRDHKWKKFENDLVFLNSKMKLKCENCKTMGIVQ